MGIKYKCKFCHEEINDKPYIIKEDGAKRNSYYCSEDHYNKQKAKVKFEPVEYCPRRELTDLILSYYEEQGIDKHNINWTIEMARIKNILEDNKKDKWSLEGLTYTLIYMHDIEKVNLFSEEANCVMALVPFYYSKAEKFYYDTVEVEEAIDKFEMKDNTVIIYKKYYEKEREVKW